MLLIQKWPNKRKLIKQQLLNTGRMCRTLDQLSPSPVQTERIAKPDQVLLGSPLCAFFHWLGETQARDVWKLWSSSAGELVYFAYSAGLRWYHPAQK